VLGNGTRTTKSKLTLAIKYGSILREEESFCYVLECQLLFDVDEDWRPPTMDLDDGKVNSVRIKMLLTAETIDNRTDCNGPIDRVLNVC